MAPLHRAAELSDSGNAYLRLAQAYIEREDWDQATSALAMAIEKGNLGSPGHAYVLLGIASANRQQWAEAEHAFVAAQDFDSTQSVAVHWLRHLASLRSHAEAGKKHVAQGGEAGQAAGDAPPSS
jgi:tetratricopeptide (TPR) repeat protein